MKKGLEGERNHNGIQTQKVPALKQSYALPAAAQVDKEEDETLKKKERKAFLDKERGKRPEVKAQKAAWHLTEKAKRSRRRRWKFVRKEGKKKRKVYKKAYDAKNQERSKRYQLENKDKINLHRRERYKEDESYRENRLRQAFKDRVRGRIKREKPKTVKEFLSLGGRIERIKARKRIDKNTTMVKLQSLVSLEDFDFIVTKGK